MVQQGRRRITVDLGSAELYRAVRIAAAERDASMREVIVAALEEWLARQQREKSDMNGKQPAPMGGEAVVG